MEPTNYVAKAKSLFQRSALVLVPLAAAASAGATTIQPVLPTGNHSCYVFSGGECSGGVNPISTPGIVGVEFYTQGWVTMTNAFSTTDGRIGMSTFSGAFPDSLPSQLPVFYDFSLDTVGGAIINYWILTFQTNGSYYGSWSGSWANPATTGGGGGGEMSLSAPETGAGNFTGMGVIDLTHQPSDFPYLSMSVTLEIQGDWSTPGAAVQINVPQGSSFDFGASAASAVPEPATAGIAVAGLALAALLRSRRKA